MELVSTVSPTPDGRAFDDQVPADVSVIAAAALALDSSVRSVFTPIAMVTETGKIADAQVTLFGDDLHASAGAARASAQRMLAGRPGRVAHVVHMRSMRLIDVC